MSRQLGTTEWTRCPPAGTPVAPEFCAGLSWLFTGEGGITDLSMSEWKPSTATSPRVSGKGGLALNFDGTSATELKCTNMANDATRPITVMVVCLVRDNTDANLYAELTADGLTGFKVWLSATGFPTASYTSGGSTDSATALDALTTGVPHVIVARRDNSLIDIRVDSSAPASISSGLGGIPPQYRAVGQFFNTYYLDGEIYLMVVWNRLLPDSMLNALMRNPWSLFSPARRRIVGLPLPAAQYLRPSSDVSAGTWTASAGASLYGTLDEISPDDGDYITTTESSICKVSLGIASDPSPTTTPHIVRYRVSSNYGEIIVRLKQGATTIATWVHNPAPAVLTTFAQVLSAGEVSSINYANALELEFEATT